VVNERVYENDSDLSTKQRASRAARQTNKDPQEPRTVIMIPSDSFQTHLLDSKLISTQMLHTNQCLLVMLQTKQKCIYTKKNRSKEGMIQ